MSKYTFKFPDRMKLVVEKNKNTFIFTVVLRNTYEYEVPYIEVTKFFNMDSHFELVLSGEDKLIFNRQIDGTVIRYLLTFRKKNRNVKTVEITNGDFRKLCKTIERMN